MSRYIDADALGIGKADRNVFKIPEYADGWNSAIEIIANAPTADVVDVVRCKDCKHLIFLNDGSPECTRVYLGTVHKNDYCSYGERRTN